MSKTLADVFEEMVMAGQPKREASSTAQLLAQLRRIERLYTVSSTIASVKDPAGDAYARVRALNVPDKDAVLAAVHLMGVYLGFLVTLIAEYRETGTSGAGEGMRAQVQRVHETEFSIPQFIEHLDSIVLDGSDAMYAFVMLSESADRSGALMDEDGGEEDGGDEDDSGKDGGE
jgi:hypothetical protein